MGHEPVSWIKALLTTYSAGFKGFVTLCILTEAFKANFSHVSLKESLFTNYQNSEGKKLRVAKLWKTTLWFYLFP